MSAGDELGEFRRARRRVFWASPCFVTTGLDPVVHAEPPRPPNQTHRDKQ
jgi:hypothetical protein